MVVNRDFMEVNPTSMEFNKYSFHVEEVEITEPFAQQHKLEYAACSCTLLFTAKANALFVTKTLPRRYYNDALASRAPEEAYQTMKRFPIQLGRA